MDIEEKDIQVKDKKMHYAVSGEGEIIVLVHGWCNNWMGWIPLINKLKKNFKVYAIDQMGFGKSARLKQYSVEIQADYLAEFVKLMPIKPLLICGLSLGTFVVADCILRYPQASEKIVLIGAVLPTSRPKKIIGKILEKSLEKINGHDLPEKAIKKIIEQRITAYILSKYINMYKFNRFLIDTYGYFGRIQMSRKAYIQMGISASKYRLDKTIDSINKPTLLVFGAADKFTKMKNAKNILQRKNIVYAEIPESGHITSLEKPNEVAFEIRKFVQ